MKLKIMRNLAHSVRVLGLILFLYAVLTGYWFGVIVGFIAIGFDLWGDMRIKIQREQHEQFLEDHRKRLDELISQLTPEEREEFERRVQQVMAEMDEARSRVWWRRA